MRLSSLLLAAVASLSLAGCLSTPGERALGGAVAGAVIADVTDNNVATGAVIGGLAGAVSCGVPGLPACN